MDSLAAADGVGEGCHQDSVYISEAECRVFGSAACLQFSSPVRSFQPPESKAHRNPLAPGRAGWVERRPERSSCLEVSSHTGEQCLEPLQVSDEGDNLAEQRPDAFGEWREKDEMWFPIPVLGDFSSVHVYTHTHIKWHSMPFNKYSLNIYICQTSRRKKREENIVHILKKLKWSILNSNLVKIDRFYLQTKFSMKSHFWQKHRSLIGIYHIRRPFQKITINSQTWLITSKVCACFQCKVRGQGLFHRAEKTQWAQDMALRWKTRKGSNTNGVRSGDTGVRLERRRWVKETHSHFPGGPSVSASRRALSPFWRECCSECWIWSSFCHLEFFESWGFDTEIF